MVVRAPYGGGVHGALYHSQSVEAFFTHVPGLKVVIPSTPNDAKGLLRSCIRDEDPVLFFEHKKMYRSVRGEVPDGEYTIPLGQAAITQPGSQITVIAYGLMAHYALEAAERVADEGIERRGRRPADAPAARQGDDPRVGPEDRQVHGRLRGQPLRGLRRRGRGDHRRGGVRLPRRPGHADRRTGRAGRARTTTSSRTGSWSTPRRSRTASASSPRTDGDAGGRPRQLVATTSWPSCTATSRPSSPRPRRDGRVPGAGLRPSLGLPAISTPAGCAGELEVLRRLPRPAVRGRRDPAARGRPASSPAGPCAGRTSAGPSARRATGRTFASPGDEPAPLRRRPSSSRTGSTTRTWCSRPSASASSRRAARRAR